jgi:copper transport protein
MLLLGVTGCRLLGEPLTALLEWMSWRTGAQSSLGFSLLIAGVGLVALVLSRQRLDWVVGRAGAVAGSFVAIVSFGFTGHAATAAPAWLMSPAVIVHALCAAFWLGSLRPLLISLRVEPAAGAHAIFSRFSTYAVFAVALILVLGVLIAAVQIERVDMLWGSTYGLILTGKVAAVALLLMIAAYNKWWSTSLLVTDAVGANRQLRLAIYGEYALFALVLALTAALGQVEPPRALLAREAVAPSIGSADYRSSVEEGGFKISLWVAPALTGHSAVLVDVRDESNRAVAAKEVTLDLSLPAAGIEALRRVAARDDSGQFVVHSDDFIAPGHWRVDVHVLIDDFTKRSVSFDVPIR